MGVPYHLIDYEWRGLPAPSPYFTQVVSPGERSAEIQDKVHFTWKHRTILYYIGQKEPPLGKGEGKLQCLVQEKLFGSGTGTSASKHLWTG